jgi:REP element-mobilizing transposase RayT
MPRRPREEEAGAVAHVCARGNERRAIYRDERDRLQYLRLLRKVRKRAGWLVLAYCLMDNHVHLLIETPEPNLGDGMRWFHGHYARYFNDRYERSGHLFQGRYKSVRQRSDEQLMTTLRYIALNPVVAGLSATASGYSWSSHRSMALGGPDPILDADRVLWFLAGGDRGRGRRAYAELTGV